ncbi:MAG: DUF4136 domain-containing protein [Gammaproteobacteria bacterium]|jgi:hypothetical protein|nr:DUF4136 domain-containing protein [Gammaproteobacteria bacterium]
MNIFRTTLILALLVVVSACSSSPDLRSDYDPSADFSKYRTYGFVRVPGTDQAQYQTLITQHFKNALRVEMDARGYRYVETDPDLLLNFNAILSEKVQVTTQPSSGMYYGYRGYGAWGSYGSYTDVRHYTQGTVNVDMVDAKRQQLVWEGVAEGTVKESSKEDIGTRIANVIKLIMQQYPFRAQVD